MIFENFDLSKKPNKIGIQDFAVFEIDFNIGTVLRSISQLSFQLI